MAEILNGSIRDDAQSIVFIYTVICRVPGHLLDGGVVYVGQTIDPTKRWGAHCKSSKRGPMQTAIQSCGVGLFEFEVVACCAKAEIADAVELEMIAHHRTEYALGRGFNVSLDPQFRGIRSDIRTPHERKMDHRKIRASSLIAQKRRLDKAIRAEVAEARRKASSRKNKGVSGGAARREFLTAGLDALFVANTHF